jgi:hypothetical protein
MEKRWLVRSYEGHAAPANPARHLQSIKFWSLAREYAYERFPTLQGYVHVIGGSRHKNV